MIVHILLTMGLHLNPDSVVGHIRYDLNPNPCAFRQWSLRGFGQANRDFVSVLSLPLVFELIQLVIFLVFIFCVCLIC